MLRAPLVHRATSDPSAPARTPALALLDAVDLRHAYLLARSEIERAPECGCCESLHDHVVAGVGSVLFFDDDPRRLASWFVGRAPSLRQLAAAIVLYGRPRIDLYSHP